MASSSKSGKKPRKITLDMVLASTSLTKSSTESSEAYLQRVTHLHLQGKRISVIEGLDLCTNLKVLYLYDNMIEKIENLQFASIVQYVHLQNNRIKEMPDMPMPSLTKLYLDENEISMVRGLEACKKIEELHIANQRLPSYTSIQFDYSSLEAISKTLLVLEISGNGITKMRQFTILENLKKLFAGNNQIAELEEIESIMSLPRLAEATFTGNPCALMPKYRDHAIGASSDALRVFDGLPVQRHQQIAIRGLVEHRKKLGIRGGINKGYSHGKGDKNSGDIDGIVGGAFTEMSMMT